MRKFNSTVISRLKALNARNPFAVTDETTGKRSKVTMDELLELATTDKSMRFDKYNPNHFFASRQINIYVKDQHYSLFFDHSSINGKSLYKFLISR